MLGSQMRLGLAITGLVLVAAACRVDATVTIVVAPDGTGHVDVGLELDRAAIEAIGGLDERVRVNDLVDAGWVISGPFTENLSVTGTSAQIGARKAFDHPEHLDIVLAEVIGPKAISEIRLVREREFAETTWLLSGRIDLSRGLPLLADAELTSVLEGLPFARSDSELAELAGCLGGFCDPATSFTLTLVADMPSDLGQAPELMSELQLEEPEAAQRWTVVLGDPVPTLFQANGVLIDATPRTWRTVSLIAGGLFFLVSGFQILSLLMSRRRRTVAIAALATSQIAEGLEAPEASFSREVQPPTTSTSRLPLRLVVLGGIGVVWDPGGDPEGLLVPFVREQGGVVDPSEVADRYRSASLGHLSSGEFWASVGVSGDPDTLDRAYLSRVRMRSDVLPFLERMEQRGLPVACLTNAVLPWSMQLQRRFGLEQRVNPWVVSGEIGARKPSSAMFEALRRISGVDFTDMLLIDSEPVALDAARTLGMSTVLLRGAALVPEGFSHPTIDGFAGLFRARPVTST
ncbi:MAG: hypothetical protein P8M16_10940 [Acidimicrobiales bacterium]|nr:hypothetical protein [Acidimicrobiales bacterium]